VLYQSLANTARDAAAARATQIASQLRGEEPADLDGSLLATDAQIGAVQIVDAAGTVLAASNGAPSAPLSRKTVPSGQSRGLGRIEAAEAGLDLWVTAGGAVNHGKPLTILVGADREPVEGLVTRVAVFLAAGSPLIVALVIAGTYRLVGAALHPVESLRARVASISGSDLGQRVPVPATGDEVAQLAGTMNEMLERLEAAQLAQRRFVSDASHELRSPLTTITTALELAQGRPDLIDSAMVDESLLPEARRMRRLIEDLLLLARSDEDALTVRRSDVDIDDVLLGEASRLRAAGVTVRTQITPCRVTGDPVALARAVRNLVDNAAQHAVSAVELSCRAEPGRVVITVADDGAGVPAADRLRIFERFVRLDPVRTRSSGGTGLGLAIVAEIVRAHHGSVEAGDTAGGGATFILVLPEVGD
jgi:signal transduction histidine kinase